jgi:hypothetical protein
MEENPIQDSDLAIAPEKVEDLVLYREGVETLMRLRSARIISNAQPDHAAILFEVFFSNAKQHVRIFCKKLSRNVFGSPQLIEAAKWALHRGVKISVVIQDEHPEDSEFVKMLIASHTKIFRATGTARDSAFNFSVMDEESFRIEPDRDKCVASASMYHPESAKTLVRLFETIMTSASIRTPTWDSSLATASV